MEVEIMIQHTNLAGQRVWIVLGKYERINHREIHRCRLAVSLKRSEEWQISHCHKAIEITKPVIRTWTEYSVRNYLSQMTKVAQLKTY